jgi:hypothetical protein
MSSLVAEVAVEMVARVFATNKAKADNHTDSERDHKYVAMLVYVVYKREAYMNIEFMEDFSRSSQWFLQQLRTSKCVCACPPPERSTIARWRLLIGRSKKRVGEKTKEKECGAEGMTHMGIFRLEPRAGGTRQPRMTHPSLLSLHNN